MITPEDGPDNIGAAGSLEISRYKSRYIRLLGIVSCPAVRLRAVTFINLN
jgi:hypothetical protein